MSLLTTLLLSLTLLGPNPDPVGRWVLHTVDGASLPASFDGDAGQFRSSATIRRGALQIRSDGTAEYALDMHARMVINETVAPIEHDGVGRFRGRWESLGGGRIQIRLRSVMDDVGEGPVSTIILSVEGRTAEARMSAGASEMVFVFRKTG